MEGFGARQQLHPVPARRRQVGPCVSGQKVGSCTPCQQQGLATSTPSQHCDELPCREVCQLCRTWK